MKYIVTNIEYDTDGEVIDLPTTLTIDVPEDIISEGEDRIDIFVSDEISNITGFCHLGFSLGDEEEKKTSIN